MNFCRSEFLRQRSDYKIKNYKYRMIFEFCVEKSTEVGYNTQKEAMSMLRNIEADHPAFYQLYKARLLTDEEITKMSTEFLRNHKKDVRSHTYELVDSVVDFLLEVDFSFCNFFVNKIDVLRTL